MVNDGTIPYSFAWSNGATTEDLNNVPAGNYSVIVTDANSCLLNFSSVLTEPASLTSSVTSPTFPSGDNISCFSASDGSIDLSVNGGSTPYAYAWGSGATTQDLSSLGPGNYLVTVTDVNNCTTTANITLTEPAGMSTALVSITYNGGYNITCFGASDGAIDLTVTNGSAPLTYLWNNGTTTEDISNVATGNFSVTVTDVNGCTSSSSAVLTQPMALSGNFSIQVYNSGTNISCNGLADGAINLTANNGTTPYSFAWSNGATTEDLSSIPAGNYSVVITDDNGCTLNLSTVLTEPAALTSTITSPLYQGGTNISCFGAADGSVDLSVNGGSTPYVYAWGNGTTTQDLSSLGPGNYSVTVTDFNDCTVTNNIALTEPTAIVLSISPFTDVVCHGGNDGSATVNTSGGVSPYAYLWETGQTTATVTNFSAGIHTVTVTDLGGCMENQSVTIAEPLQLTASVTGASTICIGQSAQISATPSGGTPTYTYNWVASPADVSLLAPAQNPTVSPVVTTTYTVTITDANGCILVADPVTVQVNPPLSVIVSANGPIGVCPGASTSINFSAAGGNGIYTWTVNSVAGNYSSPYTAIPASTGYYIFTVYDNCGTAAASDSILITVFPLPVVNFSADTLSGCEPVTVVFTDNTLPTPATYSWNFGDNGSNTTVSSPVTNHTYNNVGIYSVQLIATTPDGCIDSLTINNMIEVFSLPTANFTLSPTTTNVLEALITFNDQSSGAYSWSWDFGDNSTSILTNPEHFYSDTGIYTIWQTVTTQHGCKDSTQREVHITPDFMIYVPKAFTPDVNGLNDGFHVYGEGIKTEGFEFRVFTRWGEEVFSTFDLNGQWLGDYNGNGKPVESGVYVYTVLLKNIHNRILFYKGHVVLMR